MKTRLFRALGISISIALLIGLSPSSSPALAKDDTPPKPEFAFSSDEALTADPKKPAEFILLNHSTESLKLELDIKGLVLPAADEKNPPGAILSISTKPEALEPLVEGKVALASGDVVRLYLHVNAQEWDKVKPGAYTGFLAAADPEKSQKAIQREIKLVVPAAQAQSPLPEPLYEAWSLKVIHYSIKSLLCKEIYYLPLKVDSANEIQLPRGGSLLGYLTGPDSKQVEVWAKSVVTPDNSPHGVKLEFIGPMKPGAYTAKLDLLPDDKDKGTVTMTVNMTHGWFWPVFFLVMGLVAVMKIQRYIGVGRKVDKLVQRQVGLDEHLRKTSAIKAYRLDPQKMEERLDKLTDHLEKLDEIPAPTIEDTNKNYTAAIAELDALEAECCIWGGFDPNNNSTENPFEIHLAALKTALDAFGTIPPPNRPPWPMTIGTMPAFYQDAMDKLNPKSAIALKDITVLDDKVQKATTLLGNWKALNEDIRLYRMRIAYLMTRYSGWPNKYKEDLHTADCLINQAWGELWLATDADDLKTRCTNNDIVQVEALLLGLNSIDQLTDLPDQFEQQDTIPLQLAEVPAQSEEGETPPGANLGWLGLIEFLKQIGEQKQPPSKIPLEARYSPEQRKWREGWINVMTLLIAIPTALTALYIGKNFGTFMDYMTIFTWGATSKVLVDGLDFLGGKFKWTLK